MKPCSFCPLLLVLAVFFSGCAVTPSYRDASHRHYTYTSGQKRATLKEWRVLTSAFENVMRANEQGASAADAQYALASCWIWRIKEGEEEALPQAMETLQKLIQTYGDSPYVSHAHYWLGRCYAHGGNTEQAMKQYQTVMNRYSETDVAEDAQLALARAYSQNGYVKRAETLYTTLVESAKKPEIALAAAEEGKVLRAKQHQNLPVSSADIAKKRPVKRSAETRLKTDISKLDKFPTKSLTRDLGLTAKTIVIDAGHGGKDPGALGIGGNQEKVVALSIAKKLRTILMKKGYHVPLTRDTNRFIPLKARTAIATQKKADLFISIHANASKNSKANGVETYYLDVMSTDTASEQIAARENTDSGYSIQELNTLLEGLVLESKSADSQRLAKQIQQELVKATGAIDRGVKHARFVVLIGTSVPAILVETGFMTHPAEGKRLTTGAYQQKIATAIALGIDKFLEKPPREQVAEK